MKQKPTLVARQTARPLVVKTATEEHSKLPTTKVKLKKYSLQFKVPSFSCTGSVSYRMVQDDKVLAEGRTKNQTMRVYTDSDSEVSLYIAGDKRYEKGEVYVEEVNADKTTIPAWATAKPQTNHKHLEKTAVFDKHDWVDVSKIYASSHVDTITESKGIFLGAWTPPPAEGARDRRYVVKVDGYDVVLYWETGSCDNGLTTHGRNTCTKKDKRSWYMPVDQVIARTHPKVFKVLFDVIKELKLTYVHISSSWRPGIGSSAHREGRALDITQVKTASTQTEVKDLLPGSGEKVDYTDSPTHSEPALVEKLRKALYAHAEVEQIFTPWRGMFVRAKSEASSFKNSYVFQPVPTKANAGESEADFKARKAAVVKANKDSGVQGGESATFKAHRNHLHFHIKLD